jgi:hypothetical protein
MSDFWNARYAEDGFAYGIHPNHYFKQELELLEPGHLLLPCEGEGRNAVFAAQLGWHVHAFDQSVEGRNKCLLLCKDLGVDVTYDIADATAFDYGEGRYDAVGLIFAHFPPEIRRLVHLNAFESLKPGGMLLLEAFNPAQLGNESGGPKHLDMLYTIEMLTEDFRAAEILFLETANVDLDEGPYHRGQADVIRMRVRRGK